MGCIFCMIGNHEINSSVVYEDDLVIAILDLSQANKGHTLVMPKKHYATLLDVDEQTFAALSKAVNKVMHAIYKAFNPDGINIINNTFEAAGQTVMHAHIHIIPRYNNDGLKIEFVNNEGKYNLEEVANKIKEKLN